MFKSVLDNSAEVHKLDPLSGYDSLIKLGHQFEFGFHHAKFANLDIDPLKIKNVVFAGMGGSNLAGKVILSLSPYLLKVPFEIVSNYRLPNFVSKSTLVIVCSYSGETEEAISCLLDAEKRSAKVIAISTGGQLIKLAQEKSLGLVKLDPAINPSRSPRYGLMLTLGASLGIISRLSEEAASVLNSKALGFTIEKSVDLLRCEKLLKQNPAKDLAQRHLGQGIIFIGANHLSSVAEIAKNYINESAKSFSAAFSVPDMNHHFLDGLIYPSSLRDSVKFIILNSDLYPQVIQKRIKLTQEILAQQKYQVTIIKPESEKAVEQVLESLVFFLFFSYYLSIANGVNPVSNPWVDYFKKHL